MMRRFGLLAFAIAMSAMATSARASIVMYSTSLSGPNESPPNASLGTGYATVVYDDVAHTMSLNVIFSGLTGTTTASHIHAATAVPGVGTAGVATTTPNFAGFPLGVTSGSYSNVLDMTLASSYNPAFITANGGTTASAEAALFAAMAAGRTYWNIHSSFVAAGEIRGFLTPVPEPASVLLVSGAAAFLVMARRRTARISNVVRG